MPLAAAHVGTVPPSAAAAVATASPEAKGRDDVPAVSLRGTSLVARSTKHRPSATRSLAAAIAPSECAQVLGLDRLQWEQRRETVGFIGQVVYAGLS
jgi:hypothetical protein